MLINAMLKLKHIGFVLIHVISERGVYVVLQDLCSVMFKNNIEQYHSLLTAIQPPDSTRQFYKQLV